MTVAWGVAGTGNVAHAFARALVDVEGAWLTGVGSRSTAKAAQFADTHGILRYGTYEELMVNPDVDVVYVATPASHHYPHARMALEAGKHVLVEKPFTVNAIQANTLRILADVNDLFLMEAAWCRFLPSWIALRRLLDDQVIGDVHLIEASFGGKAQFIPEQRPFRNDLAGGALLDGGVYPLHLAHMVLGSPYAVEAVAMPGESSVDVRTAVALQYPAGALASVTAALLTTLAGTATIYGADGMIQIPGNFTNPSYVEVVHPGEPAERIDCAPTRDRLAYQIDEVHQCIAAGETVSPVMSPSESCAVMATLDRVRDQIGLRFPPEVEAL